MNNEVKNLILISYFFIQKFRYIAILVLVFSFSFQGFCQQAGDLDLGFNFGRSGYHFSNYGYGANGVVNISVIMPNGKILIGGNFTSFNGISKNGIARLNANGTLDQSFNSPFNQNVSVADVELLPNGKILVAETMLGSGTARYKKIFRLHTNGVIDTSFNNQGVLYNNFSDIEVLPDGKILVCGDFRNYGFRSANGIAKLKANGTIDSTFYSVLPSGSSVLSCVVMPNGKIIIGGKFGFELDEEVNIARLNSDGTRDESFNAEIGTNRQISKVVSLPDGKILIGGDFSGFGTPSGEGIFRLHYNGDLDQSFRLGTWLNGWVKTIVLKPNGKILIGKRIENRNFNSGNLIMQLNSNGSIDPTFNASESSSNEGISINHIAVTRSGDAIVCGEFKNYGRILRTGIVMIKSNGSADSSFNDGAAGANSMVNDFAVQTDGKIITVGEFNGFNGRVQNYMVRLQSNGAIDETFDIGNGPNGSVKNVVLQPDGKIIISGAFRYFNNIYANKIARLNSDGSFDRSFRPNIEFGNQNNFEIKSMAIQPDGKLLVAVETLVRSEGIKILLTRLNTNGSIDPDFNPSYYQIPYTSSIVSTILIQPDNKILVGGNFNLVNGLEKKYIARLNTNGTLDSSFNAEFSTQNVVNSTINELVLQPDGKIILAGSLNYGSFRYSITISRLNANGSLDRTFSTAAGTQSPIKSVAIQPDGKIIIGGYFNEYNGLNRNRIARLNNDGRIDVSFNPSEGADNEVNSILVLSDGKILIGGWFTGYNQYSSPGIARIYADTVPMLSARKDLKSKIEIYPNPTTGIVTLTTDADAESISITNSVGQLVFTSKAQPEMELNLNHLAKGVYTMQVQSSIGISTQRLVIQ